MTVFKGFMTLTKRNLGISIMYFAIFLFIAILTQKTSTKEVKDTFQASKINLTILNHDGGDLAKGLTDYLSCHHTLVSLPDERSVLQEKLFNRDTSYIITIPEDFEQLVLSGKGKLPVSKVPESTTGMYVDNQIDSYLNCVRSLMYSGYSAKEATKLSMTAMETNAKITLIDKNGNNGQQPTYAFYFQFFPYIILALLCFIASSNILTFRKREITQRMQLSAISNRQQNLELTLAYTLSGIVIWASCILISLLLYGKPFLTSSNFIWYLLNSFVMMLVAMAIAFLIGVLVKREVILTPVCNVLSLAMSFLCGVFVPMEMINHKIINISKFLPVYWYEKANILLYSFSELTSRRMNTYLSYILIQFLFAAACLALAFMFSRQSLQEK